MSNEKKLTAVPDQEIDDFKWVIGWIAATTGKISMPSTDRNRSAAACFAIAQEHHEAIVRLAEHRLFASSFALLRVVFEAYVRGLWLSLCATDNEVSRFIALKEPPKLDELLKAIDSHDMFTDTPLSGYKVRNYKQLCAFTHTGGHQIMRWNHDSGIEPVYQINDVMSVIVTSEQLSLLSLLGVTSMGNEPETALSVIEDFVRIRDERYPSLGGVKPLAESEVETP